jgi:hypothetical protein
MEESGNYASSGSLNIIKKPADMMTLLTVKTILKVKRC